MSHYWFNTFDTLSPEIRIHVLEQSDWDGYLSNMRYMRKYGYGISDFYKPIVKIHFSCYASLDNDKNIIEVIDYLESRLPQTKQEVQEGFKELHKTPNDSEESVILYLQKLNPTGEQFAYHLSEKVSSVSGGEVRLKIFTKHSDGDWRIYRI